MDKKEVFKKICDRAKSNQPYYNNCLFGSAANLETYVGTHIGVTDQVTIKEALEMDLTLRKMFEDCYNFYLKNLNKMIEMGDYIKERFEK